MLIMRCAPEIRFEFTEAAGFIVYQSNIFVVSLQGERGM